MHTFLQILMFLSGCISMWIGFVRPHAIEEKYSYLSYERLVSNLYEWSHGVGYRAFLKAARMLTTRLLIYTLFMFTLEPLAVLSSISNGAMDMKLMLLLSIAIAYQWIFLLHKLYAKRYPSHSVKPTSELVKYLDMVMYMITSWWMIYHSIVLF